MLVTIVIVLCWPFFQILSHPVRDASPFNQKKKYKIGHFCEPQIWMFSNWDQWQAGTRTHETKPSSRESLGNYDVDTKPHIQKAESVFWYMTRKMENWGNRNTVLTHLRYPNHWGKNKVFCGFNYLKNCFKLPGNPVDSEVIEVTSPQHVICIATHKSKNNESMKDWIGKKLGEHSPTNRYQLPGLPWARSHQLTEWPYHRTGGLAAWIKTKCDAQKHRKISSWLF